MCTAISNEEKLWNKLQIRAWYHRSLFAVLRHSPNWLASCPKVRTPSYAPSAIYRMWRWKLSTWSTRAFSLKNVYTAIFIRHHFHRGNANWRYWHAPSPKTIGVLDNFIREKTKFGLWYNQKNAENTRIALGFKPDLRMAIQSSDRGWRQSPSGWADQSPHESHLNSTDESAIERRRMAVSEALREGAWHELEL